MNKETFQYKEEIQKAFDSVKKETVINCIKRCNKIISNSMTD